MNFFYYIIIDKGTDAKSNNKKKRPVHTKLVIPDDSDNLNINEPSSSRNSLQTRFGLTQTSNYKSTEYFNATAESSNSKVKSNRYQNKVTDLLQISDSDNSDDDDYNKDNNSNNNDDNNNNDNDGIKFSLLFYSIIISISNIFLRLL